MSIFRKYEVRIMITFKDGTFYENQRGILLLAGEVHYFRLDVDTWATHLDALLEAGCNTVSTYVPWLVHEQIEGVYDFGEQNPSNNLSKFLKMAQERDLYIFLRPGPFVMAELKNEGLPFWIYQKYPNIQPLSWLKKPLTTSTLDLLDSRFLQHVNDYYTKLFEIIKPFLQQNHGKVIAIQLDNEVGMLSWVSNRPELTKDVLSALGQTFDSIHYHSTAEHALFNHHKLTDYMRIRNKTYLEALKSFFDQLGVTNMNYFINIHGTSHGRGKTFPIGISQLFESYQNNDMISGTDVYYGNVDLETFHDVYIVNAMVNATIRNDSPATTLEFNVGDGNFGDDLAKHYLPSAVDFKIRMSILQNHKMLNYYLFSGGINQKLNHSHERIAITGARHGFAAPVQPSGEKNYTFWPLKQTTKMLNELQTIFSLLKLRTDGIYLGMILDYFKTEFIEPDQDVLRHYESNLSMHRQSVIWDTVLKQLLLLNYSFQAVHLENSELDVSKHKLLICPSSQYMSERIQNKLIAYEQAGGKLWLIGEIPRYDLFGKPCVHLAKHFEMKPLETLFDHHEQCLSVNYHQLIKGETEYRTFFAQTLETKHQALIKTVKDEKTVAFKKHRFVFLGTNYPGDLNITKSMLEHFDMNPEIQLLNKNGYLFSGRMQNQEQQMILILNLEHYDVRYELLIDDKPLFDFKTLHIFSQDAYFLPLNIDLGFAKIRKSTAEISAYQNHQISFRLTQPNDYIEIESYLQIDNHQDIDVVKHQNLYKINVLKHAKLDHHLTIYFKG
jgi:beta-galactosidase